MPVSMYPNLHSAPQRSHIVLDKAAAWAAARKVNAADPVARYVQSGATGAGRDRSRRQRGRASRRRHARAR